MIPSKGLRLRPCAVGQRVCDSGDGAFRRVLESKVMWGGGGEVFGGKGVGGQSDPLEIYIYDFSHLYLNSSRDE